MKKGEIKDMANSIGSTWNIWDLHVHTPFSILNNQFGDPNNEETWDKYVYSMFTRAIDQKIKCIGITDYFIIDGYNKIVSEYLHNDEKLKTLFSEEIKQYDGYLNKVKEIKLFPNIELRLDLLGTSNSKLQLHIIFSDELSIDTIKNNFLNILNIKIEEFGIASRNYYLSKDSIENFGKEIVKCNLDGSNNPLFTGFKYAQVSFDKVRSVLKNDSAFNNKYIIVGVEEDVTSIKWESQAGLIRKNYLAMCDSVFSGNPSSIKWFSSPDCYETLGKTIPCIWGSDSHDFNNLLIPDLNRYLWIKSDISFCGFIEALNSYRNRAFIGTIPSDITNFNTRKAYTISSISCHPILASNVWFDFELKLNPFMISIIGNKGSGKSALTDIIAKTANSYKIGYASFLNEKRFCKKPEEYNKNHTASIDFYVEDSTFSSELNIGFDQEKPELVKYLPQAFIENICNDLTSEFQNEINQVLFSYIDHNEREGCKNLVELLSKKTAEDNSIIKEARLQLAELNSTIIALESKQTRDYKNKVKTELALQQLRLKNHLEQEPDKVEKPTEEHEDLFSQISIKLSRDIEDLQNEIGNKKERYNVVSEELHRISTFFNIKKELVNRIDQFKEELEEFASSREIDIKFKDSDFIDLSKLKEYENKLVLEKNDLIALVGSNYTLVANLDLINNSYEEINMIVCKEKNLNLKLSILLSAKEIVDNKTTLEQQSYLRYLDEYKAWERTRKMIVGEIPDTDAKGSIKQSEDELFFIENLLETEIKKQNDLRNELIKIIFDCLESKRNTYLSVYNPIQKRLNEILKNNDEKIEFGADITIDGNFANHFLFLINQAVSSKYKGNLDGLKLVNNSIEITDFNCWDQAYSFLNEHYRNLTEDMDRRDQLTKGDPLSVYNYLLGFQYLNVNYSLKMGNKSLKELSPGERGILLLIFYLSLDTNNCPLIIDQPEDNLDNQSIYSKLVPCILEAKKHRQIIVVTHNPNIAVACDSEQIVYCSKEKNKFLINYLSGSIENQEIKTHIVDILEGTKPAFEYRKLKYNS